MEIRKPARVVVRFKNSLIMNIVMFMIKSRRWKTIMKRLSYLRAEAADCVDTFEESVKEIEERLGDKKKNSSSQVEVKEATSSEAKRSEDSSKSIVISTDEKKRRDPPSSKDAKKETQEIEDSKEDQADGESETDIQYRKLWREIAKLTHPDVSKDDEDIVTLYKAAAEAHEKKRRGELLDVASEVGVVLPDPHEILLVDAHKRCVHYENLITKVRDSIAWQWKNSAEATQNQIIELILKSRSEKSVGQE